jgi:hypothetical protein
MIPFNYSHLSYITAPAYISRKTCSFLCFLFFFLSEMQVMRQHLAMGEHRNDFGVGPSDCRPPLYNSEDYISGLKKFSKLTGLQMYLGDCCKGDSNHEETVSSGDHHTMIRRKNKKQTESKEHNQRMQQQIGGCSSSSVGKSGGGGGGGGEMALRQFASVSEMLIKLKSDLELAFPSFLREFLLSSTSSRSNSACAADGVGTSQPPPSANVVVAIDDGVTLLLDLLKAIQLSQTNITGSLNQLGSRANHVMFKRALGDEYETLVCLKLICGSSAIEAQDVASWALKQDMGNHHQHQQNQQQEQQQQVGAAKLVSHPSGLFTVAVCVMSNYSKSRVLSLQLLGRLCDLNGGHKQVSDAVSMLRLRFGEPVRFKFLVGMLNSYNSSAFQVACLRFLNRFVETSADAREKIMIQTELQEAGFDSATVSKFLQPSKNETLKKELDRWNKNYIDVNGLVKKLLEAERANRKLREELSDLRQNRVRNRYDGVSAAETAAVMKTQHAAAAAAEKMSKPPRQSRHRTPSSTAQMERDHIKYSTKSSRLREIPLADDDDSVASDVGDACDLDDNIILLSSTSSSSAASKSDVFSAFDDSGALVSVSAGGTGEDLVTVLASDGHMCITTSRPSAAAAASPTKMATTAQTQSSAAPSAEGVLVQKQQQKEAGEQRNMIKGFSGDSGLSSDSSEKDPSDDKSSRLDRGSSRRLPPPPPLSADDAEAAASAAAETTANNNDELDDYDAYNPSEMANYVERNVLREEETIFDAERISIDKFRQRFCSSSLVKSEHEANSGGSSYTKRPLSSNGVDSVPTAAPPPPPRYRRALANKNSTAAAADTTQHGAGKSAFSENSSSTMESFALRVSHM